jgi:fibrillarin-like rRNA methylase
MEVRKWKPKRSSLAFTIGLGHKIDGSVQIYLPWQPKETSINGIAVELQTDSGANIYTLYLSDANGTEIKITA